MRSDFVAFILTHGRPNRVKTYELLRKCGYTGRIVLVIDNEDKTAQEYFDKYGDDVVVFNKPFIENFAKHYKNILEIVLDNLAVEIPVFLSVFNKNSNVKQNNSSSLLSVNCFIFSFFLVECFNSSNF